QDVGDVITLSSVGAAAHGTVVVNGNNAVYTPAANYNGSDTFTYTISDGHGGTATGTVNVTVVAVNDNPVLDPITNKSVQATTLLTFAINATDIDGDTLTYNAVSLPTGATFNPSTKTFSWTPTAQQVNPNPYNVTFTVVDGHGGSDLKTVSIT